MKKKYTDVLFYCIGILLLSLFVLLPLLQKGFIVTDDGDWMVIRLTAFYQAFTDGQFPVRYLGRLNYNFGYPVANFLYPGFLYIGTILRILKLPFTTSVELILGVSIVLSAFGIFFWLRRFFRELPSFIGGVSVLFSPYFLYDLYKRGSVGEVLATASLSLLLWSIESNTLFVISPITTLLLVSHNTLALIYMLFIGGYIIVRKKWNAIVPIGIGVIVSAFFWLPAFFERSYVNFDKVIVSNPQEYFGISQQLLFMGLPLILSGLYLLVNKKIKKGMDIKYLLAIFSLTALLSTSLSGILWKLNAFVRFVQFPYRMLSLTGITGSFLLAFTIEHVKKHKKIIGICVLIFFIIVNIPLLKNTRSVLYEEGFYTTNEGTTTVHSEYMPKWVLYPPTTRANEKITLFSGKGTIKDRSITTKKLSASLNLEEESIIELNVIYYPGWGVSVDNRPFPFTYENNKGVMQVMVPKGSHTITFEFRETAFRYMADVITSVGVLLYGMYLIYLLTRGVKNRKKAKV